MTDEPEHERLVLEFLRSHDNRLEGLRVAIGESAEKLGQRIDTMSELQRIANGRLSQTETRVDQLEEAGSDARTARARWRDRFTAAVISLLLVIVGAVLADTHPFR